MNKRDIEFLFELGSLKNIQRGWRQHLGMDCANVIEHTLRVVWLALILGRKEGVKDEEKLIKMALVHDLAETRVSDLSYVQKVYAEADEERAAHDTLEGTSLGDFEHILDEYEKRESLESKVVKDADNLDVDIELKELEERGSKLVGKWKEFRKRIPEEKLYTESAKEFWVLLQESDVSSWHMVANKWVKQPKAGK